MRLKGMIYVSGWATMLGVERPAFPRYVSSKVRPAQTPGQSSRQGAEVKRLAGPATALKWQIMARIRLSRWGLPPFKNADRFIVGSSQSKRTLHSLYGIADERISSLPYPIDLELFHLETPERSAETVKAQSWAANGDKAHACLHICWLGRIVPRKRLDLFLGGSALAIREGIDLRLTIVGGIGFIPGYEKMIEAFPFRERLIWKKSVPRQEVPSLLRVHDVLVQPSDEEDFGSSVAEAQACGLPVVVGRTNGNADYLCSRDIHLKDDRPETLADAYREMSSRKAEGNWGDPAISRQCERKQHFSLESVTASLIDILKAAASGSREHKKANQEAVSLIIPTLRRPEHLARCLASLVTQTLKPTESWWEFARMMIRMMK